MHELTEIAERLATLSARKRMVFQKALRDQGIDWRVLPIVPRPRMSDRHPLSFAQQRLWFLEQFEPAKPIYNLFSTLRFLGKLDLEILERSINEIVRRHEILRTWFLSENGEGRQVVHEFRPYRLDITDICGHDPTFQKAWLEEIAREEALAPFDLSRVPLFRIRVVRCSETDHVVMFTVHHIVFDAWSEGLMASELRDLYTAFVRGLPSPLPEPPIQYLDFANWQRDWMESEDFDVQQRYWEAQLRDAPAVLALPLDHQRPAQRHFRGGMETLILPETITQNLYALCRRQDATLYMLMLAAFNVLLERYSGQKDICVGTSIANRPRPETEKLIGFLVNTLVMRNDLSGDPAFVEFLERVKGVTSAAYAHQDMPFEKLVDLQGVDRRLIHAPLFQVFFVLENVPDRGGLSLPGVALAPFEFDVGMARFDLTLRIREAKERQELHCCLGYNTDLFDRSTITRMLGHYRSLLEEIVAQPQAHLSALSLLTPGEREQVVVAWNATGRAYAESLCVHQLFEAAAHRQPEAVAVVADGQRVHYGDLNRRANQLARYLRERGVGPGVHVGLCMDRSVELVVGILGILKAGGAYVPLEPTWPPERLACLLNDAGVALLLTQARWRHQLPAGPAAVVCLDREWEQVGARAGGLDGNTPPLDPQNVAYLIYTSGSTGQPKGVAVAHCSVVNYVQGVLERLAVPETASFALVSTVAADLGHTMLFGALCSGRPLHLISAERGSHPDGMAEYMHREQIEVLKITPSHLAGLLDAAESAAQVLPKRCLVLGGEAVSWPLIERIQTAAPHCTVINHYGPTETTVGVLTHRVEPQAERQGGTVPIGRPLANSRVYLLDERLEPVPIGLPGELYIGGVGLAQGYHQRPELTAERFLPDPFAGQAGGRLYRTGDRARYGADGTIEFLGRQDAQVKLRGFRIELGEIEAQLRAHPEIRDAVVVLRQGAAGTASLVAYVVAGAGAALPVPDLRQHLARRLPEYMVPSAIVVLEALPLTANGKVDRKALPAPEETAKRDALPDDAPRTEFEQRLAAIWAEVLQRERVGIHDNFFELGGDSILSLQIIARAHRHGIKVTPKQLFERPTIAAVAAVAVPVEPEEAVPSQEPVTGMVPLTPIQHWFFEAQHPNPHHWNQAVLLAVTQPLELPVLQQAVHHLVAHHDALRLRFTPAGEGTWQQWYAAAERHPLCRGIDLTQAARAGAAALAAALEAAATEVQRSLDIVHGPLLQVASFDLGAGEPGRLLLVAHHLVVDGVSWRVLVEDLQTAYRQLEQGQPVRLPAKTTSFQHWAQRLSAYADAAELRSELEYWVAQGRTGSAAPPLDASKEENRVGQAKTVSVSLSLEETQALLSQVPPVYRTEVNDILLTALAQTLCRWTGQPSVCVELEGHGREDLFDGVELSRTVGWFTTRFPVWLTPGEAGPGAAIRAVKEQLRRIPHKGIGYGVLRYLAREAGVRAALAGGSPPQVAFNYLGQLDGLLNEAALFRLATESPGLSRDPHSKRGARVTVTSQVVDHRLCIDWTYPATSQDAAVLETLAHHYIDALRNLIAHCATPEAGGVAASDFPQAGLTDAELSELLREIR